MNLHFDELEITEEMMGDTATRVVGILTLVFTLGGGIAAGITLT